MSNIRVMRPRQPLQRSTAARQILQQTDRLDIAMMNAGVMALPLGQTRERYEVQFGTNHMGQALLLKLLTPLLPATASRPESRDVRVVWNTSQGYALHLKGGILFEKLKTDQADISFTGGEWVRYGRSKSANFCCMRGRMRSITRVLRA